jgi:hypothetical protein
MPINSKPARGTLSASPLKMMDCEAEDQMSTRERTVLDASTPPANMQSGPTPVAKTCQRASDRVIEFHDHKSALKTSRRSCTLKPLYPPANSANIVVVPHVAAPKFQRAADNEACDMTGTGPVQSIKSTRDEGLPSSPPPISTNPGIERPTEIAPETVPFATT